MGNEAAHCRAPVDCPEVPLGSPARPSTRRRSGGWRDWWTLLHPPYTAWHLAYVVIGACLAPVVDVTRLIATLLAFFCAVGLAAHALDELHGRPLHTQISGPALVVTAVVGLVGALALGIAGVVEVGPALVPFLVVGPLLVLGYNFELFGGAIHNDVGFAASWGAFPVLVAYVAQTGDLALAPVLAAGGAFALSAAQRALSTPARLLRRRAGQVQRLDRSHRGRETSRSTGPPSSPLSSGPSEPCRGRSCCWPPAWPSPAPASGTRARHRSGPASGHGDRSPGATGRRTHRRRHPVAGPRPGG